MNRPTAYGALAVALLLCTCAFAENWPQWRGPNNDGISTEKNVPTSWGEDKNIAWKFKLPGIGASTPAVWGDKIFLTAKDGNKLVLLCVSTAGKELWRRDMGAAAPDRSRVGRGDDGAGGANPSPSTDGKSVFAFVFNGDLAAFDFTGKELWRFNAQTRYGKFRIGWGFHSTPLLHGDHLYCQFLHSGAQKVVCLNKSDGKEVWAIDRKSDGEGENLDGYTSPFLWKKGKDAYLVIHGNDYATAHSLKDGKEIWRVGELNPADAYRRDLRFVASPVCTPDLIVIPTAKNHGVVGIRPDAQGTVAKGSKSELWRLKSGTPDVPSPLVHDGLVYLCGESGSLTVLDAKDGKQVYRKQVGKGRHRSSPVYANGNIYLAGWNGTVNVVQAGKEYKLVAENKLPDEFAGSPAVSGGRIYIRGNKYLWAIEGKK